MITNKGEGIRRLTEQHGLTAAIYPGDDVSDTDAFRVLRAVRGAGNRMIISSEALHQDSPARLITLAYAVVDVSQRAKSSIQRLVERRSAVSSVAPSQNDIGRMMGCE